MGSEPGVNPIAGTVLVLGGARSGKSAYAEGLLRDRPDRLYVATGQAHDHEMAARIARHRDSRGPSWRTIEAPVALPETLAIHPGPALVDCLTLWLTNLILGDHPLEPAFAGLERVLTDRTSPTVLVASEVGLGIVPGDALSRRFRDEAGLLHQRIARLATSVVLVAAGLPLRLK